MRLLSDGTLTQRVVAYKCIFNKNIREIYVLVHIYTRCVMHRNRKIKWQQQNN